MLVRTLKQAEAIAGSLGEPSKMPGYAYGISAKMCQVGGVLAKVKGSVCHKCYALRGHYQHKGVAQAHAKRLQGLAHPMWVDAMVFMIRLRRSEHFRWHDSGDLQSLAHLEKIADVCWKTPEVKHWLPTREQRYVNEYLTKFGDFPPNLCVRVSATMINGEPPTDFNQTSTVVTEGHTCPAPEQGNSCGSCRKCWDRNVKNVAYKKH